MIFFVIMDSRSRNERPGLTKIFEARYLFKAHAVVGSRVIVAAICAVRPVSYKDMLNTLLWEGLNHYVLIRLSARNGAAAKRSKEFCADAK